MTELDVVVDSMRGKPISIVLGASAWQQPTSLGWFERSAGINELLRNTKRATHLLRVVDERGEQETWHAGRAGVSIAAGIERMAIKEATVRDAVVVVPLDARIYCAELEGTLVRHECAPYPSAFKDKVASWRASNRKIVTLTDAGLHTIELRETLALPFEFDVHLFTFRRAFVVMLHAGVVHWRDCVRFCALLLLLLLGAVAHTWLLRNNLSEGASAWPTPELSSQPSARFSAGAELAAFAALVAEHDVSLWRAKGISRLDYEPETAEISLFELNNEIALLVHTLTLPVAELVEVADFSLSDYREPLRQLIVDMGLNVVFDEPFEYRPDDEKQTVVVTVADQTATRLIDLAASLRKLPIEFHSASCGVTAGSVAECVLSFAIQGLKNAE